MTPRVAALDYSGGPALKGSTMVSKLLLAWLVVAFCVVVHASGVTGAMRWVRRHPAESPRFWLWVWLFVRLAGWIIVVHLVEIAAWASLYEWQNALPDLASALYFSAVTYTTTGYGDLVLPAEWRLVGGIEALTGILMCGWSTGFFFAIVSRMFDRVRETERT
jgi:Ion channel